MLPHARERYGERLDIRVFEAGVALAHERATTLVQIADQLEFLFTADEDLAIATESWEKVAATEQAGAILDAAVEHLGACEWSVEAIDLRPCLESIGVKPRKGMPVLYSAIEGRHAGLPLFDSIHLLGRDSVLIRLRRARARLG